MEGVSNVYSSEKRRTRAAPSYGQRHGGVKTRKNQAQKSGLAARPRATLERLAFGHFHSTEEGKLVGFYSAELVAKQSKKPKHREKIKCQKRFSTRKL